MMEDQIDLVGRKKRDRLERIHRKVDKLITSLIKNQSQEVLVEKEVKMTKNKFYQIKLVKILKL